MRSGYTVGAACGYCTGVGVPEAATAGGGVHGSLAVLTRFVGRAVRRLGLVVMVRAWGCRRPSRLVACMVSRLS